MFSANDGNMIHNITHCKHLLYIALPLLPPKFSIINITSVFHIHQISATEIYRTKFSTVNKICIIKGRKPKNDCFEKCVLQSLSSICCGLGRPQVVPDCTSLGSQILHLMRHKVGGTLMRSNKSNDGGRIHV